MYLLLVILPVVIVVIAEAYIKKTYSTYSKLISENEKTGKEVAELILSKNNVKDIKVTSIGGMLSDHYNPKTKTLALSSYNYSGNSIAAIAVSAHECGHVIQHETGYLFLKIRSILVPIVNLASRFGFVLLIIGSLAELFNVLIIGLVLLGMGLVFQLVTLPVEYDASKRAKKILIDYNVIVEDEMPMVDAVLNAALLTYVASFISNILQMLRLFMAFSKKD